MKRSLIFSIVAAMFVFLLAGVHAQETARKTRTISGTIKSVDAANYTVVIETQAGDRVITLRQPRGTNIFHEEVADESAVVSGSHVEVSGRVSDDQTSILATRIAVYNRPRGFEILDKTRIDGKIEVEDGKMRVTAKEKVVEIQNAPNMQVVTRKSIKSADILVGAKAVCWGPVTDGGIEASILTFWTHDAR